MYRAATAASLALAPLLFLIANLLHPEEFTRDHEAQQLAAIGASYTTWQVAHLFTFASIVTFAPAILGLAYLVRRRSPTAGLVGGALGVAGLFGLAFADALDGYTWGILGELYARPETDKATLELALHDVQQSTWSLPYYLMVLPWVIGLVTLAATAARNGTIPRPAGLLLALGTILVGLEGAIQDNAYFIVAATTLFVGGTLSAYALARTRDPAAP